MPAKIPKAMKAWTHTRAGHPSSVLTLSTLPIPTMTSSEQTLVRVSHCALNPGASIVMQLLPFMFRSSPAIPEMDFSGTIVSVGDSVPNLRPGTQVFGSISTSGALAEYVAVPHTAVTPKPKSLSMKQASGLGIAGITALELLKAAGLKRGNNVLVNGASGGVGHLVLQMCMQAVGSSGKVVAVCSSRNVEWVEKLCSLPNCQVIAYDTHAPVYECIANAFSQERFDAVIDAVGVQDIFNNCLAFLREGKPYVTVGPKISGYTYASMLATIGVMAKNMLWPQWLGSIPRPYAQVAAAANLVALEELVRMVDEEGLKVHVGKLVKMYEVQEVSSALSNCGEIG
jgi:NADPH:quinone reductase-like Zn-dependent oxidoreductase